MTKKPFKQMAEVALYRTDEKRLYCRNCRQHFLESDLREKKMSLRFCSDCTGWQGVSKELAQKEKEGLEVFYQLGLFERS